MAKTIEELNFQLKVDDKAFKAQMEADKKAARELADTVRDYLNIKRAQGTLSAKEYQTLKRLDNLESNRRINAEKELAAQAKRLAAEERLSQAKEKTNQHQERHNRLMQEAASLAASYLSIWGAKKLLSELVQVTGEFEMQRTTLKAMLQDANGANAIYEQIKQLAVVSPFGFKELVTYTKQLAAYSVPIGELYDTTKMLADVSAGLGVGMDRLVLAYGQVRSAAFLRGQEVRQFTEAGIPILDMLAKQFEELEHRVVSTGEVFDKISRRQVPFEMVAKVFKDMTSEGGKFFNMQEIQAETLQGKISNLKDAYEIMLSEIGEKMQSTLKGTVDSIRNLISNYEQIGKQLVVLAASYGVAKTALTIFSAETFKAGVANTALSKSIKNFVTKNPYTLLAAGVAALAMELYKVITYQDAFAEAQDKLRSEYSAILAEETGELNLYYAKLKSATEGTEEYDKAKKSLYGKYADYIEELRQEGVAVDDLTVLYDSLVEKINDAARARMALVASSDIRETYAQALADIYGSSGKDIYNLQRAIKELGLTDKEGQALWGMITGTISRDTLEGMEEYAGLIEKINKGYVSLGPGSRGPMAASQFIDILIKKTENATTKFKDATAAMEELFGEASNGNSGGSKGVGNGNINADNSDAVKALQDRISLLEKLRDVYESMRPYFSDTQIKDFFAANFGFADKSLWENLDFDVQIDALIGKLDALGEEGREAADKIREKLAVALGKDMVNKAKAAAKELEDFNKKLEKYRDEAKSTIEKIEDLEKSRDAELMKATTDEDRAVIISHYTTEIDKLKEELVDITSIQLTDFWQQLTGEKNGTYANLTRLQRKAGELIKILKGIEPNRDKNGKITGYTLTQENAGDFLKSIGIDEGSLQLTVAQVEALNKAFDKLFGKRAEKNGIFAFVDAIKNGGFKNFWEDIKNGSGSAVDILKGVNSQMSELGNIFTELGEATDSDFLKSLGDTFSFLGGFMDKLTKGDLLGAVGEVVKALTGWITQSARLYAAISQAADEAERLNSASRLAAGVDTIWGEDTITSIRNATAELKKYKAVVDENRRNANKEITWKRGIFNMFTSSKSLSDMVAEMGYNLYDAYGNLNAEALQAILDTYESLTDADRKWIEGAIRNSELYKGATEQLNDAMKDTWGNLADSMTDKLIEARKEVGDAYHALADDLRATFGDMADDIAKKLISSFIQKNILANYADELADIYDKIGGGADETQIADAFSTLAESVLNDASLAADFTNRLYDAFEQAGMTFEQNSNTLANGIKGITEDTANLLASYVNAIRADVAYGKVQRDNILAEVKNIASYVASPTLMDYLNRIQANTFDTAQNTRDMLTEIRSMMTNEGGLAALRVYQ